MNAILSLVLSLILAFSGGAMPAVPETTTTYTLGNIVLTVQDETIVLNPSLKLAAAAGAEQAQAQFSAQLGEDILMPMAGEITPDGVKFQLGEGRAYELSAATLSELAGMSEPDAETAAALQQLTEMAELLPEIYANAFINMEENFAVSEELWAHWTETSGATPESFEVEVNGVNVPVTCVQLNLTLEEMYSSLDLMLAEGSEAMQAYYQQMLELMNLAYGSEAASFAELLTALPALNPEETEGLGLSASFPIELTYGSKDGLYYMEELVDTEMDGIAMNVSAVTVYENGVCEESLNMTMGNEELTIDMGGIFAYDLDGNLRVNFEINGAGSEDTPLDMNIFTTTNIAVGEDGLKTSSSGLDILVSVEEANTEYDYSAATEVNVSFSWDSAQRFEEDGSITTDNELNLYLVNGDEVVPVTLAFSLNRAEAPFADAFEGVEMVQLPADTEDEAYQMLGSELFGLAADLMTLSMDESVMELMELFEAQAGVLTVTEVAAPADEYAGSDDPAYLDEGYFVDAEGNIYDVEDGMLDYPEYTYSAYDGGEVDYAAAAGVYGYELPAVTAPEGYHLDWMYVSSEYCSMDFVSEEGYFISLTLSPIYGYTNSTMQVNADGSLSAIEGATANVQLNEDGSYLYIDISLDGTMYSFYVDGVPAEDVQAALAGIVG